MAEYTFLPSTCGTFSKKEYVLGHRKSQVIFFRPNGMKLNNRKKTGKSVNLEIRQCTLK